MNCNVNIWFKVWWYSGTASLSYSHLPVYFAHSTMLSVLTADLMGPLHVLHFKHLDLQLQHYVLNTALNNLDVQLCLVHLQLMCLLPLLCFYCIVCTVLLRLWRILHVHVLLWWECAPRHCHNCCSTTNTATLIIYVSDTAGTTVYSCSALQNPSGILMVAFCTQ
jgi:hypothetical protein